MAIIKDLDYIKQQVEEDWDENIRFRTFLKGHNWSDRRLDACVHEIAREVADQIDCTACANCCRVSRFGVDDKEISRLAEHLGLSENAFRGRCIETDDFGDQYIKEAPCPFLEDNKCRIYEDRPGNCRDYPYLLKKDFRQRLLGVIENAEDCPIVFNTLEILKREMWGRRR